MYNSFKPRRKHLAANSRNTDKAQDKSTRKHGKNKTAFNAKRKLNKTSSPKSTRESKSKEKIKDQNFLLTKVATNKDSFSLDNYLQHYRCTDLNLKDYGIKSLSAKVFNNPRFQAALAIFEVIELKHSLIVNVDEIVAPKDIGFTAELAYGVIRYLPRLNTIANQLLEKPFKKNRIFSQLILLVALYQLIYMDKANHAAVYENVELVKHLYKDGTFSIINASLRNFLRKQEEYLAQTSEITLLPRWFEKELKARVELQHNLNFHQVVSDMHQRPPLWLRINRQLTTIEAFLTALDKHEITYKQHPRIPTAVQINNPIPVHQIPGFNQGWFAVQDLSSQLASIILSQPVIKETHGYSLNPVYPAAAQNRVFGKLTKQPTILDTCCSPGGKTTHLLQIFPKAQLIAVDIDAQRLERVYENLNRFKQQAQVICADARDPATWLPPALANINTNEVDLMLLDVPCSGTGVIRRHPDIKWLRTPEDITNLAKIQNEILQQSWQYLAKGGKLLYTTCSILQQENEAIIKQFLAQTTDAKLVNLQDFMQANLATTTCMIPVSFGVQMLNMHHSGDGFYYCLLVKE